MPKSIRDRLFEERSSLIDAVISSNHGAIQKYRLCRDDVRQELAVRMLELLDGYDPLLCPNLDAYLAKFLNYALLDLTRPSRRYGIPYAPTSQGFEVVSLEDNCHRTAVTENPFAVLEIWDEINALPPKQRDAVRRLLYGGRLRCTGKALNASRKRIHRRIGAPGTRYRFKKERDSYAKAAV